MRLSRFGIFILTDSPVTSGLLPGPEKFEMHLSSDIAIGNGIAGGVLIGASSTLMLFFTGKVTGISGIVERIIISDRNGSNSWVISYVAGLISSGVLLCEVYPEAFGNSPELLSLSPVGYAIAGFLTGFGTRMGSGCTSGHGICGLPRRSLRSLAAVATFMVTGALASHLVVNTSLKQLLTADSAASTNSIEGVIFYATPTIAVAIFGAAVYNRNFVLNNMLFGTKESKLAATREEGSIAEHAVSFSSALLFGLGLGISGMCNSARVTDFLNFTGTRGWDPTLMGVMGGGVLFNALSFSLMHSFNAPVVLDNSKKLGSILKFDSHQDNLKIDVKLIIGSALFGIGWGLGKK